MTEPTDEHRPSAWLVETAVRYCRKGMPPVAALRYAGADIALAALWRLRANEGDAECVALFGALDEAASAFPVELAERAAKAADEWPWLAESIASLVPATKPSRRGARDRIDTTAPTARGGHT